MRAAAARTPHVEAEGAGEGERDEEGEAAMRRAAAEEEEALWQSFWRHHEGVGKHVRRVLNKLRALCQRGAYKEVGVCVRGGGGVATSTRPPSCA